MTQYDLVIIGSGPGGYVSAVRAGQLGMKVACVEQNPRLGGVCLNVGCIPSKALLDSSEYYHLAKEKFAEHGIHVEGLKIDLSQMMQRKEKIVEEISQNVKQLLLSNHVEIVFGKARLLSSKEVEVVNEGKTQILQTKNILLSTGSKAIHPSLFPYDGNFIVDSTQALSFDRIPEHLVVVGGGYIGLELGSVWNRLGSKVTVIEMLPQIAVTMDKQIARLLDRSLRSQGLQFRLNTKVTKAEKIENSVKVTVEEKGKTEEIFCDRLLLAVGRRPATEDLGLETLGVKTEKGQVLVDGTYQTNVPGVYAIGDIIPGPMLAHKASAEGIAAVECIAGLPGEVNYDCLPCVIYTWPEVASVGLTEEQIREKNIPYKSATYPFSATGRARCLGEKEGLVKMCVHEKNHRILGVHIIGARASELIGECVVAMEFNATCEQIARSVHGHPTFSEAIQEAAMHLTFKHRQP
ncbi:MAG: dihydrolipoyl dehydrogenase [Candidatus Brocadiae bacterium]|nr:dihydrolipoyl dehydrogenase [Candidatus Brocadiia bacterium]